MTCASLASGIELEYDTFGSLDDPTLRLVMGFTVQMQVGPQLVEAIIAPGDITTMAAEVGR